MNYKDLVIKKDATSLNEISYFVCDRKDVNKIVYVNSNDEVSQESIDNIEKVDSIKLLELFVNEHKIISNEIVEVEKRLNDIQQCKAKCYTTMVKCKKQIKLINERIDAKEILNKVEPENKIDTNEDIFEVSRCNTAFYRMKSVLSVNNFNLEKLNDKLNELNKALIQTEKLYINFQNSLNLQNS